MAAIQQDIKDRLSAAGKTMADLSRDSGIKYNTLNQYLNGLADMPDEVRDTVENQFKAWAKQDTSKGAGL